MKQPEEKKSVELEKTTSPLPSRGDYHKGKKKKTKFKIKYPVVRLLALLFILLPVAILSYKFNSNPEQIETTPVKRSANFESISYQTDDESNQAPEQEIVEETEPVEEEQEPLIEQVTENQSESEIHDEVPVNKETGQDMVENNAPTSNEETKQSKPKQEKPKDSYDVKYHKVEKEETLYRISMKYYNSRSGEDLIKRWNNLDGNTVVEGQVLQIPIKKN